MRPETLRNPLETVVEPVSAWHADRGRTKQRDGQRRKFFETMGLCEGLEQSTNSHGNLLEAGDWLPECDIAREKVGLAQKRRLQAADSEYGSAKFWTDSRVCSQ